MIKQFTAGNACMSIQKHIKIFTNVKAVGKDRLELVYIGNINIKNNVFLLRLKKDRFPDLKLIELKNFNFLLISI